jgi:alpha-1,3-glucosyltransferase
MFMEKSVYVQTTVKKVPPTLCSTKKHHWKDIRKRNANTFFAPSSSQPLSVQEVSYKYRTMVSTKHALLSTSLAVAAVSAVALLRVLVGYQPHSGQDDYHGSHGTYGGDFEAQRHWMELTWQLPLGQWYYYDLGYWGLDYPPLTAYVSWICGALSSLLIGPESVALETSRGLEDPLHKAYMRGTVLVLDLLLYGSIVWVATRPQRSGTGTGTGTGATTTSTSTSHDQQSIWFFLLAMAQPAILLIDHGHFQYNTTALGLALWSFYFMTKAGFQNCVVGSILFCCALSFKQMTLYYAPAVFCYLLGRCFAAAPTSTSTPKNASEQGKSYFIFSRFVALGVTVLVTFALLWWPFVVYGPDATTALDRLMHVLRRIIPLQRGLFEGKVSNIWCVLSVKPVRIRERFPAELQPLAALALTLLLVLPSGYKLFRTGQEQSQRATTARAQGQGQKSDWKILLWGTTSSALAFFLASFQVHEKSLLLALAPASLLFADDALFSVWFSVVAAWTMWPLLVIDRLQTAYVCTVLIFTVAVQLYKLLHPESDRNVSTSFFRGMFLVRWIPALSYVAMLVLHGAEVVVKVPSHLPDLFPVLWSIVGCGFCCIAWLGTCWHLYQTRRPIKEKSV